MSAERGSGDRDIGPVKGDTMNHVRLPGRSSRLLASVAGVVVLLAGVTDVRAEARTRPVSDWVRHHAVRLDSVDPGAPLSDMESLRRSVGDATIVGLGESIHGSAEETELKHRTLRFLVE